MLIRRNTFNIIKRTYRSSTICYNILDDLILNKKNIVKTPNDSPPFQKFNRFRPSPSKAQEKSNNTYRNDYSRNNQLKFYISSASESAQAAIREIILRVQEISPDFQVRYLNADSNRIEISHLARVVNSLDLAKSGITCIEFEDELPLIKLCKIEVMLKGYGDKLAKIKEEELLAMGSTKTQHAIRSRAKAASKRSAEKVVSFRWGINIGDLANQKKSEIMKRLSKGENLSIKFQTNTTKGYDSDASHLSHTYRDKESYELELKKRELVKQTIESILAELPCTWTFEGNIETKCAYKLIANKMALPVEKKEQTKATEEKEQVKKPNLAQKLEVKHQERKDQKSEEDLDALYSFKIED
ncbi:Altered inheritance of mitochondria protein 23 mitochondrial [Spathaspora sp. JA1]|nr:Altered inheritance of mitochondria protein 23 mitochondrial [Spathaspora sp. JA1]